LAQTKFAAKIMFVLPGVPLVFYGQETGNNHSTFELPSFDPNKKMKEFNPRLWKFYQDLISLRQSTPELSAGVLHSLKRETPTKVSFVRKLGDKSLLILLDFEFRKVF